MERDYKMKDIKIEDWEYKRVWNLIRVILKEDELTLGESIFLRNELKLRKKINQETKNSNMKSDYMEETFYVYLMQYGFRREDLELCDLFEEVGMNYFSRKFREAREECLLI